MILVVIENTKLKLALAIPTGTTIMLAKEAIDASPLVAGKTIVKIVKDNNISTKSFTHCFSFTNFRDKLVFDFVDFI